VGRLPHYFRIAAGLLFLLVGPSIAEEVEVVKSGKYYGKIDAYRVEDRYYLSARDAAKIYAGQRFWKARGVVLLSFRGRKVSFQDGSSHALMSGKKIPLARAVLVRARRAFIPVEFFTGSAFSGLVGVDTKFNPGTRLLLVDNRADVGPLRWFTYEDHTRIVLEVANALRYTTVRRGRFGFDAAFPNGTIEWSEKIDINDGAVEYVHLFQEKKQARLSIKMQAGSDGLTLREFKKPRRIVIDVARKSDAAVAARARRIDLEAPAPPKKKRWYAKKRAPKAKSVSVRPGKGTTTQGALSGAPAAARPKATKPKVKAPSKRRAKVPPAVIPNRARRVIAVDAGHGGKDGGAVGRRGTLEKDVVLAAAHELARLLKEEGHFDVVMTRSNDTFVKLGRRAEIANERGADLFVSIHANANPSRKLSGFEVYFLSERASDPGAERLAEFENSVLALEGTEVFEDEAATVLYALAKTEFINDSAEVAGLMTKAMSRRVDLRNRGVKQAGFYVLRGVSSPSVLVEMAFLSNARDEAKLQSKKYRRKIVEGVYAGIIDYAKRHGWLDRRAR
jgi:N-acetylmuramoyl-L-alanine amidase